MKSWKTTVCGIIAAAAAGVASADMDPIVTKIAGIIAAIATAALGYFARDNKVTSEDAGAK
jgi:hypothetical protein